MGETDKTKEQLVKELAQAQKRIAKLEAVLVDSGKTHPVDFRTFKAFFESATDSFSIWDSNLNMAYLNEATLMKYYPPGTKRADVIGKHFIELVPGCVESGRYEKYLNVLNTGKPFYIEEFTPHPKFGEMHLAIKVFRIENGLGIITIDITERKRIEQALQDSRQRLSALIDNAPDAIFTYDTNGKFLSGNRRAEEMLGYSKEEMLGKTFAESGMFTKESLAKTRDRLAEYKKGKETPPLPFEMVAKDGTHVFVEVRGVPIVQKEKVEVIAIARDITERKMAEEALQKSEEKLRAVFESIGDSITVIDINGNIADLNDAAVKLFGCKSKEEVLGMNSLTFIAEENQPSVTDKLNQAKSERLVQYQFKRKDGSIFQGEASSDALRNSSREITGFIGIVRDITERKALDDKLRQSEEKIRQIFNSVGVGITVTDIEGKVTEVNDFGLSLCGYSKEEMLGHDGICLIAERDRPRIIEEMVRAFKIGQSSIQEFTALKKDGTEYEVEAIATVMSNAFGKPAGLIISITDIAERKRIERELKDYKANLERMVQERTAELASTYEELQESEEWHRALVETSGRAGIGIAIIQSIEGREAALASINDKTCEISGYSREELLKMSVEDLIPLDTIGQIMLKYRERRQGEPVTHSYETEFVCKDKVRVPVMVSVALMQLHGKPTTVAFFRDITERKQWEAKLKESKDELRFYLNQITKAQEEERKRIARELHDDTIQELIALSRQLDDLIDKDIKPDEDRRSSRKKVAASRQKVDMILQGVRRFTRDLRPSVLDDLGLVPALEWLTSDMSSRFGVPINISLVGTEQPTNPDAALAMFRIAQESLRNAGQHSKASQIQVNLKYSSKTATLSIIDNGAGFTTPKQTTSLTRLGKLGIAGMHERAQLIGATLSIKSKRNKGTAVTLEVPIK